MWWFTCFCDTLLHDVGFDLIRALGWECQRRIPSRFLQETFWLEEFGGRVILSLKTSHFIVMSLGWTKSLEHWKRFFENEVWLDHTPNYCWLVHSLLPFLTNLLYFVRNWPRVWMKATPSPIQSKSTLFCGKQRSFFSHMTERSAGGTAHGFGLSCPSL